MTHEVSLLAPAAGALPLAAAWVAWRLRRPRPGGGLALGARLPRFGALPASDGARYASDDLRGGEALVLLFHASRCPGVAAYDARVRALHAAYAPRGVQFLGVNSVSPALYPTESLAELARAHHARQAPFPTVKDEDQRLAHALGARCTPHAFVFDRDLRLRYRGRIDNAFVAARATQPHLRDALDDVLADRRVRVAETLPLGCAIDWVRPTRGGLLARLRRAHRDALAPAT